MSILCSYGVHIFPEKQFVLPEISRNSRNEAEDYMGGKNTDRFGIYCAGAVCTGFAAVESLLLQSGEEAFAVHYIADVDAFAYSSLGVGCGDSECQFPTVGFLEYGFGSDCLSGSGGFDV